MAAGEQLLSTATQLFQSTFNCKPCYGVCAPGRVNLIGEHTDYNDGFVFPMAINFFTVIVGGPSDGNVCHVVTNADGADEPRSVEIQVPSEKHPLAPGLPKWANYIKGVMAVFKDEFQAFKLSIVSSVPLGSGLSSSASLEVAMYTFLETMSGKVHDQKTKALACQRAEHKFPGMPCGIMDQFISTMGKKNCALLLDCRNMEVELVPLTDPELIVLIINSNVHHELTGSEYPTRRKQCYEAAHALGKKSLRDATMQDLIASKDKLPDVVFRRARHVITEIERTVKAAEAFKAEDYVLFGKLMVESHNSLRDDYEVSCAELDLLVKLALEVEGVYGSRMTGGGFGGCTVTLVRKDAVEKVKDHVQAGYQNRATIFTSTPADGARILHL